MVKDADPKDVQKVCMGELYFVLAMVGARDVPFQNVQKVQGGERIIVLDMVEAKGASSKVAQRAHKEAPIFARHTVEENDARGDGWVQGSVVNLPFLVINLLETNLVYVLPMVQNFRTTHVLAFLLARYPFQLRHRMVSGTSSLFQKGGFMEVA